MGLGVFFGEISLSSKESACNAGDLGSIPGSGSFSREENGYRLQYPCLGNPVDRGAGRATVHGVAESDTTEWLHSSSEQLHLKRGVWAGDGKWGDAGEQVG